jgi:hypothetical protein
MEDKKDTGPFGTKSAQMGMLILYFAGFVITLIAGKLLGFCTTVCMIEAGLGLKILN